MFSGSDGGRRIDPREEEPVYIYKCLYTVGGGHSLHEVGGWRVSGG
jgi:hypothetical protein